MNSLGRWAGWAASGAVALGLLSGCDKSCTEMGCVDLVRVELTPFEVQGEVQLSVRADEALIECRYSQALGEANCEAQDVWLRLDRTAAGALRLLGFDLVHRLPARLTVSVTLEGAPVASGAAAPSYDVFEPNGPGCPPACSVGSVEL